MSKDYRNPPSSWTNAKLVSGGDVYYSIDEEEQNLHSIIVWHWCPTNSRWMAQGVANHQLVQAEPLTLAPSLLWECCGKHGFIQNGVWYGA